MTTAERCSPAEMRPQALAKAPAMTRMTWRPFSKLFPDLTTRKKLTCSAPNMATRSAYAVRYG
jgi:hypothetical protein